MLRPKLHTFEVDSALLSRLRPIILKSLSDEARKSGTDSLSITQAKELLAIAQPAYRSVIPAELSAFASELLPGASDTGRMLHDALNVCALYFRSAGAADFRAVQSEADPVIRAQRLWQSVFQNRVLRWLRTEGYLEQADSIESTDVVVECVRLWVQDVASRLVPGAEIAPGSFFLDAETDIRSTLVLDGRKLQLRGRPDALILDPSRQTPEVVEYKLGIQGQIELQIAQTILYAALVDAAKGTAIRSARVQFFRLVEDTPPDGPGSKKPDFPPEVNAAFAEYIGNHAAVRRLKIECTVALEHAQGALPSNLMLCGPGGLGKTELARRLARALRLPLIDLPAGTVKSVDNLLAAVDATLAKMDCAAVESGSDSGLPRYEYPPLVVFLDEIHLLKKPDLYLNLFEPNERRAVGSKKIGIFHRATFLGATTDRGILPGPFRTRFNMIDLGAYSAGEVAAIVKLDFEGKVPPMDALEALARVSRLNPRVARANAKIFITHHRFDPSEYPLDCSGLERMGREVLGVDSDGLGANDYDYLKALLSGRRGFAALCQVVKAQPDEIRDVIEPYLLQLGLITRSDRGRELTEGGRRRVKQRTD